MMYYWKQSAKMQDALSQLPKYPSNRQTTHQAKSGLTDKPGTDTEKGHGQQHRAPQYLSNAVKKTKIRDCGKKL